jgi:UDPglucose 6-dehydrogenase
MKIAIIGTGYVGLTTGIVLAYLGNKVTCIDIDKTKISLLKKGELTIYEPGLNELWELSKEHLVFSTSYEAVYESECVFIAVGTPSQSDGTPNLSYVRSAACSIGMNLGKHFTVIINKSTVPIGSGNWVESLIVDACIEKERLNPSHNIAVASNPEFLREGSALFDTLYPDRIVIGSDSQKAIDQLVHLYQPIINQNFLPPEFLQRPEGLGAVPIIITGLASAELIKYSANSFLALKISYINEIAALAEKVGADITQISKGIGLDNRIGRKFLNAGIGWGGSCFGKDTAALVATAQDYGLKMPIIEAARDVNYQLRDKIVEKLMEELRILKGKTIGLLGAAFKPNTDDLRDAPAIDIAQKLISRDAKVIVHDPVALERLRREKPDLNIKYVDSPEEAFVYADAIVLVTEWPEYRNLAWDILVSKMKKPFIFDGRNYLDKDYLEKQGFRYVGVGK